MSISVGNRPKVLLSCGVGLYVASAVVVLAQLRSYEIATMIAFGAYVAVGSLITLRRPGNVLGPLLVAYGAVWGAVTAGLVTSEALDEAGRVDAAAWVALVTMVVSNPTLWLISAMWLLFPDGAAATPGDRRLLRWSGRYAMVVTIAGVFASPQVLPETKRYPHPFVDDSLAEPLYDVVGAAVVLFFLFGYFVAARLIIRMRHGDRTERRQVGWIAVAVIANITILLGNVIIAPLGTDDRAFLLIDAVAIMLIPLAVGVAILRYGLFDIDLFVSKSVTYLGLAAVITGLYAAVVVLPLLVIGESGDGDPGLLLPIVATAVVALLFEPTRSRMQRWANRLVYGSRTTPHEVLSRVTAQLSDANAGRGTDALAQLLAAGTGAGHAAVWLRSGGTLQPTGVWREDGDEGLPSATSSLVSDDHTDFAVVRHEGEDLGALSISKSRNDPITPADRELLADVAAGAGLQLRNMRLHRELGRRADEVRESRRRLIAAQDAERHRLERDLHDGAQQQVVSLKVKLGIAKTIAQREGAPEIAGRIAALADETQDAVDALRAVAHGIYPPLLASDGLGPALRAVERASPIPVALDLTLLQRYPRTVEETVYFCVVETIERARMSGAGEARVGITSHNGDLVTEVELGPIETGPDLQPISDRIDAAGGTFTVDVRSGRRPRITAALPVLDDVEAP